MKNKIIFGLVGSSGSGKSTLIREVVERLPELVSIVISTTTRLSRGPAEDDFYTFVTDQEFSFMEKAGSFANIELFHGNKYGTHKNDLKVLEKTYGIMAMVENGVIKLRNQGFEVKVIKVTKADNEHEIRPERKEADMERAKINLEPDLTILNSFKPGGKEKAVRLLLNYIKGFA